MRTGSVGNVGQDGSLPSADSHSISASITADILSWKRSFCVATCSSVASHSRTSRTQAANAQRNYLAAGHIATQLGVATRIPAFDGWFLEHHAITRRVEVTAPTFSALPSLVVGTNRIATVHRRAAERERDHLPIRIWEVPIDIPKFLEVLQWHKQRNNDVALNWLRSCAIEVGSRI